MDPFSAAYAIAPGALMDDGALDVVVFRHIGMGSGHQEHSLKAGHDRRATSATIGDPPVVAASFRAC